MLILGSRKRKSKKQTPPIVRLPLDADAVAALTAFVRHWSGDSHLTAWEENFVNSLKYKLRRSAVWLGDKEQAKIGEIKDRLHYDRPGRLLSPIDPDGIEENNEPDGWLVTLEPTEDLAEDEVPAWLERG